MTMEQLSLELASVKEEWRAMPGFPDYEVSNQGRMRSIPRIQTRLNSHGDMGTFLLSGCVLKAHPTKSGYLQVTLRRGGRNYNTPIHRSVLLAFKGPCPEGCYGAHRDDDKLNNNETNLRWATPGENMDDARRNGFVNPGASLNEDQVLEIRKRLAEGAYRTYGELAAEYGVWQQAIAHIHQGKSWSWLP